MVKIKDVTPKGKGRENRPPPGAPKKPRLTVSSQQGHQDMAYPDFWWNHKNEEDKYKTWQEYVFLKDKMSRPYTWDESTMEWKVTYLSPEEYKLFMASKAAPKTGGKERVPYSRYATQRMADDYDQPPDENVVEASEEEEEVPCSDEEVPTTDEEVSYDTHDGDGSRTHHYRPEVMRKHAKKTFIPSFREQEVDEEAEFKY